MHVGATTSQPATTRGFRIATQAAAEGAMFAALAALIDRVGVYGSETEELADAAMAQDVITAVIAVPALAVASRRAALGSARAHLVSVGILAFLAYNYAIYCFSVTFGPLFLFWTALLGLTTVLSVIGLWRAERLHMERLVQPGLLPSIVLCTVAVLFATLWLLEIVPDLHDGTGSTSAQQWEVPTNPVHVLDLAFALPLAFLAGWGMRARRRWAVLLAPVMLSFFVVMSLPIVATPFVAALRGHAVAWGVVLPITSIAILCAIALIQCLRVPTVTTDR
ncbi:hypothetical protein [Aeromicrobium terrae]|uniref:Uncharacterized protein n=1 Tax=Aeromicrobium terrae TaxID=2498846 RepID=A0A5C8NEV0_9ACTN|nr:hypothetical protein [Aeromicrobium terrae]TXL57501.1 hypothetical protein FHP06_14095 [Aeromicrobium terrae]